MSARKYAMKLRNAVNPPRPDPKGGIPMRQWGKDHWSVFAYIETLCVDSPYGRPDPRRIQANTNRHPFMGSLGGGEEHGIRLAGGRELPGPDYDEWDCIDDLERHGLVENKGTGINPLYMMTGKGSKMAGELRAHKARGGMFYNFIPGGGKA